MSRPTGMVSDAELVSQALQGSEEACRELVERYEGPVFGLILRMIRDRATAEDLAQETFVKAFRKLHAFDPERRFSSWLFKIAHNTTLDHLRRREVVTISLDTLGAGGEENPWKEAEDRAPSPEEMALGSDLARGLERALATLRPEYREVLLLRFREGLSYGEVAEVTGWPLGTVKTQIHRARKELARRLREEGGWEAP